MITIQRFNLFASIKDSLSLSLSLAFANPISASILHSAHHSSVTLRYFDHIQRICPYLRPDPH